MIAGATDAGIAGVMVGQASVTDSFTFYSRTQEASADQAAIDILCKNKVDGEFLINFLNKKLEDFIKYAKEIGFKYKTRAYCNHQKGYPQNYFKIQESI